MQIAWLCRNRDYVWFILQCNAGNLRLVHADCKAMHPYFRATRKIYDWFMQIMQITRLCRNTEIYVWSILQSNAGNIRLVHADCKTMHPYFIATREIYDWFMQIMQIARLCRHRKIYVWSILIWKTLNTMQ